MADSLRSILEKWNRECAAGKDAHYDAARLFERCHWWIGVPAVILAGIVGSAIVSSPDGNASPETRLLLASLSILSGVFAALQTFLGLAERASKHREAGAAFGSAIRLTQQLLALSDDALKEKDADITRLRRRIDRAEGSAATLPQRFRSRVRRAGE